MSNPLKQYFRSVKLYTKLPGGPAYYDNIEFNDDGELGVMPMTAKDEVTARNPDALLNGEAIADIIKSCVPAISNPKVLLANDIDALMIAIRHATYGDNLEVTTECPECGHDNQFVVNISQSLSGMSTLEDEYKVELQNGVNIYTKPYGYNETVKALKAQFAQLKIAQSIDDKSVDEAQKLKIFSTSFKTIANLNLELLTSSVIKIVVDDDVVTNPKHIKEFLQNVDKHTFEMIDKLVKEINTVGVKKEYDAKCVKCKHEWEATIDFNPVNFFTES